MGPHISIKGETLFQIGNLPVTNSLLTTVLVIIGFFALASYYSSEADKKQKSLGFYAIHFLLKSVYDLFYSVLHAKVAIFFPLLGAFFLFILLNNWSGLIPGVGSVLYTPHEIVHEETIKPASVKGVATEKGTTEDVDTHAVKNDSRETTVKEVKEEYHSSSIPLLRAGTADLNTTIVLAAITVLLTQFFGFKYLGAKKHLQKYFTLKNPIMAAVGILELVLEFARILSFSFRLFGNVFAGEVLLVVLPFLLPMVLSFVSSPMYMMEIFVGLIQALVFSMLSAVFISMAVSDHH